MSDAKYVALIAHDGRKDVMADFVRRHKAQLDGLPLVATATTGGIVEAETGLDVKRVLSGPRGGDLQIGAMIAEGKVRAVVFLRDPLTAHPHEPDINALMKVCDIHNVPLATNIATADMLVDNLK
ncbi:methylglyoxal synthase [Armatimonas sp.]|uniref:methylglyoxal synthase n=1 Tax=Armatimonas sp. TaxID=1872638 RepID=UPI00286D52CF|nr:methylglyoxal synthase [Armatimonas sp.]